MRTFQQLHNFLKLRKLEKLVVLSMGNPILDFTLWKEYAAFMLSAEIGLEFINEQEVYIVKARIGLLAI